MKNITNFNLFQPFKFGGLDSVVGKIGSGLMIIYLSVSHPIIALFLIGVLTIFVFPLTILYFCPVMDLWLNAFQVFGYPIRSYFVVFLLMLITGSLGRYGLSDLKIHKASKPLLIIAILFYCWQITWSIIASIHFDYELDGSFFHIFLGRTLMGLVLAIITQHFLRTRAKIQLFLRLMLGAVVISACIAILQFYGIEFAWGLRRVLGPETRLISEGQLSEEGEYIGRVVGLSEQAVAFSYHMVNCFPLMIGMLLGGSVSIKNRVFSPTVLWLATLIMAWAIFVNDTRSTIIGIMVATFLMFMKNQSVRSLKFHGARRILPGIALGAVVLFLFLIPKTGHFYRWRLLEYLLSSESQISRFPLFLAGLLTGYLHPFGVGPYGWDFAKYEVYEILEDFPGSFFILKNSPHNHLINILAVYGVPGFFLIIAYFWILFKITGSLIHQTRDKFVQMMGIGLMGSFAAELFHIQFHNAGPFIGDLIHWYLVGILLALLRQESGNSSDRDSSGVLKIPATKS